MAINNVIICGLGALGLTYANKLKDVCNLFVLANQERVQKYKEFPPTLNDKKIDLNYITPEDLIGADLIIISPGSLLTSISPHLIIPEVKDAINNCKAKKMYVCNMFTQPGETDDFKVSDHLKYLQKNILIL